jgi:hypothetical protein
VLVACDFLIREVRQAARFNPINKSDSNSPPSINALEKPLKHGAGIEEKSSTLPQAAEY